MKLKLLKETHSKIKKFYCCKEIEETDIFQLKKLLVGTNLIIHTKTQLKKTLKLLKL